VGVVASTVVVKSAESTRIILRDCEINRLYCDAESHIELQCERAKVKGGSFYCKAIQINQHSDSRFNAVTIDEAVTVAFSEPPLNPKTTEAQRLRDLGFCISRKREKSSGKKAVRAKEGLEFDPPLLSSEDGEPQENLGQP
jgi:hypothetical protein